jgi:integrase
MKFTDRFLQSIKPPEKEYCIREGHGFTLRVLSSGLKVFQYVYTFNKRRRRLNLGHYPVISLAEAREKYHVAFSQLANGIDPQAPPPATTRAPLTVADLTGNYKKYLKQHVATSTYDETERTLDKYVLPSWSCLNIKDIRRPDAILLIEPLAATAPGQARGVMKIARAMFNYALEREMVELNPFSRLSKAIPSIKATSTDRTLSNKEIKYIWSVLTSETALGTSETRRALLLLLVTAQRPDEVAGLPGNEIDGKWWTIKAPRIKTRNRRKEDHRVYLTPLARRIIGQDPGYSQHVFFGSSPALPLQRHALSHFVSEGTSGGRPDGKGHLSAEREKYFGLPRWTPNDLRRTVATKLSELGCSDEIIDAILNHAKKGVIGVYNRNKYDKEKREWMLRWSRYLKKIVK